jgi:hypothetical protein
MHDSPLLNIPAGSKGCSGLPSCISSPLAYISKAPHYQWLDSVLVTRGLRQHLGDLGAQPAKTRPFTTSTGFLRISPVANLLPLIWTNQYYPIFFPSAGWFLLHCNDNWPRTWALISKSVFQCSKSMRCNDEAKVSHVCHSPHCYKPTTDR